MTLEDLLALLPDNNTGAIDADDLRTVTTELWNHSGTGTPTVGASRFVPVVIFNGESNSGGQAKNSDATAAEIAPRPCVQIFDNTGLASFQTLDIGVNNLVGHQDLSPDSTHHGWELALANSVENHEWWDDTVYLIKTGQGGSRINQWGVGSSYWTKFQERTRNGLGLLRSQGKVPIIYVWYSLGLNDAADGKNEAAWKSEVQAYHVRLRDELGYVPIFSTQFMAGVAGTAYNDSIVAMATEDNMLFAIDATGSTSPAGDPAHWDYAGAKLMSNRMIASSLAFGQHENYMLKQIAMVSGGAVAPDLPSIVRTPTAVSFKEGSAGGTFTVALSKAPTANVTVGVSASGGNVTALPATLTFTTSNWATAQTVTCTSPDDSAQNGSRSSTVTLSSAGVAGAATVSVTVTDAYVSTGPVNSVLPAITGSTTLASVLTCSTGTWSGSPTGYAYQWKRNGTNIAGETAATHTVVAADQGTTLTCAVTATNASGSNTATSLGTSVPSPSAPTNSVLPSITGATTTLGSVMTCEDGTWTGSPTFAYQWKRGGVSIAGATAKTYTIVAADQGTNLTCTVTGTNAGGSTSATTAAKAVDPAAPPTGIVPYTYQDVTRATQASGTITSTGGGASGGNGVGAIDVTQPFIILIDWTVKAALAVTVCIDDTADTNFGWGAGQTWTSGCYMNGGAFTAWDGASGNVSWGWSPTSSLPCIIKMEKSGNDVKYSSSPDGIAWTPRHTHVGVLAGKTTQYMRVIFAVPTNGDFIKVHRDYG